MVENQVPRSIMDASRENFLKPQELHFVDGYGPDNLPDGLHGHVFIVAPVGNFELDEDGRPILKDIYKRISQRNLIDDNGNTFMNGDGMIYRFDFDEVGKVKWKQKVANPPDYKLDRIIEASTEFEYRAIFKFYNFGLIRFSPALGLRNQLNTAFVPFKFSKDNHERLLITYDAGIPYEINTKTLNVQEPVGSLDEWIPDPNQPRHLFPTILSTAHPIFDHQTEEMFTVNYSRSLLNLLRIFPWSLGLLTNIISENRTKTKTDTKIFGIFNCLIDLIKYLQLIWRVLCLNIQSFLSLDNFVYVMKWDATENLQKWKIVDSRGRPIKIRQSMHQVGITEKYVVLIDTSFAIGIEQMINNFPFPLSLFTKPLRRLLRITPSPENMIYIVPRENLNGSAEVEAHQVEIHREISHFLLDYSHENSDSKITLHAAHICAWDIAQWLRKGDKLAQGNKRIPPELLGIQIGEMDISLMARHVIDINEEPSVQSFINDQSDEGLTWGAGLYTYNSRNFPGHTPLQKLDKIYWTSLGLWEELTTKFMYDQYKKYEYRTVELNELLERAEEGISSCLYRLDAESLTFEDYYKFPPGYIGFSPQFVPRKGGTDSPTDGDIVCVAFTPDRSEIWIFNAAALQEGPVCKLWHEELNFGLTLHTAWLKNISDSGSSSDNVELTHGLCDWIDTWAPSSFSSKDKETLKEEINKACN
ncbi:MAG: lignostilbene-alpha,beta-dioxygenase [Okeania sp. SIO3B5]|uniref:carotenoid oxygenase family protein n=1 Tax=Okeania sp. SIO3B5 TaxID=2607811 RepID=UPI0013FFD586|nr:carotenoid oxygenase family protein [Okeania sp. SIO3B5]NEO54375.1 lignostilbene-alpha,beta-dioxygenase [Okeania sp. SIO3B5]